jgi:hypothetical protein
VLAAPESENTGSTNCDGSSQFVLPVFSEVTQLLSKGDKFVIVLFGKRVIKNQQTQNTCFLIYRKISPEERHS